MCGNSERGVTFLMKIKGVRLCGCAELPFVIDSLLSSAVESGVRPQGSFFPTHLENACVRNKSGNPLKNRGFYSRDFDSAEADERIYDEVKDGHKDKNQQGIHHLGRERRGLSTTL